MIRKCKPASFAPRIHAAEASCKRTAKDMQPLCRHLISLAKHSASVGYCTRAGKELAKARRMADKYPGLAGAKSRRRRRR